ncbi:MAG: ABC transporter permease, partial [Candidatus Binataceae bacterium]
MVTLSVHRLKIRYKQSMLGWAWAIIQPLSLMFIYTIIFSMVTRMPSEGLPYSLFVYSALLPWTYFATTIGTSATCLVMHSQLITKVYFPREILPITYVIAGFFDFLIAAVLLSFMLVYYRVHLNAYAFYLIPVLAIVTAFATALSLFLSALQVRIRDIGLAMPLAMQLWMFATPVVYPLSAVP